MAIELASFGAPQTSAERVAAPSAHRQKARRGLGVQVRLQFTERLSLLLDTGVNLVDALETMRGQGDASRLDAILAALAETLRGGKPFSAALALHPEMFPPIYVSLVAAAEEGGFLPHVLDQLHAMDRKRAELRSAIASALSYPAFLAVFSIAVVVFMLTVIFPRFRDMFESIRGELPAPTLVLMFVSDFLRNHWLATLVAACAAVWGCAAWSKTPSGALRLDRLKTGMPVVRDVFVRIYLSEMLGTLGMSLTNGVPITVAIKACGDAIGNRVFAAFVENMGRHVNEGRGVAAAFNESAFIPPMVRQMIATGEQTGNLGPVMSRVADFYGRELEQRIRLFAKALEPLMLIVMGAIVGVLVAALILPIFKLSRAVR